MEYLIVRFLVEELGYAKLLKMVAEVLSKELDVKLVWHTEAERK